jgi:hypothetical protein
VLSDLGLLLDGKPGRWEDSGDCAGKPATADNFNMASANKMIEFTKVFPASRLDNATTPPATTFK